MNEKDTTQAGASSPSVESSQAAHTPGPWYIADDSSENEIVIEGEGAAHVASILTWDDSDPSDEEIANARLIAAAPDLFAACEAARDWLNRFGEHAAFCFGGESELDEKLRAAVAKATGAEA